MYLYVLVQINTLMHILAYLFTLFLSFTKWSAVKFWAFEW